VAKIVAARLGWRCLDADDELERRAGKSIAAVFAGEGEPAFRDLESQILGELLKLDRRVLALGGGVVLREENRERIKNAGCVVWLMADAKTIEARVADDPTTAARRPRLTVVGGMDEIRTLLARREPLYRECANLVIDTNGRTRDEVAEEIIAATVTGKID
jgi:shikimate kinase